MTGRFVAKRWLICTTKQGGPTSGLLVLRSLDCKAFTHAARSPLRGNITAGELPLIEVNRVLHECMVLLTQAERGLQALGNPGYGSVPDTDTLDERV